MPTGTVKRFDAKTGQGFLAQDGGKDVFFRSPTGGDRPSLTEGAKVEYEIRQGKNGPEAVNVKLVGN